MVVRFTENPIINTQDVIPSRPDMVVEGALNPGVFSFRGLTWLLLRIAERPVQVAGKVTFPIIGADGAVKILEFEEDDPEIDLSDPRLVKYKQTVYLSTLSHLGLVCSEDGIHFHSPDFIPGKIFGKGDLETFGIEDCRVSQIEGRYYLTYTQVSEHGVGVGLMSTLDWAHFKRHGMILPPHNKDCAIFEEKINGRYFCLHRPSGIGLGGNFIWLSESEDLEKWGSHHCLMHTRKGMWDCERVGAGAAPIRTPKGWLVIYHGADESMRYCLGAALLDLDDPRKVIARSEKPFMEPTAEYEKKGFFGNVVFMNGHLADGDELTIYYGASDKVVCGARMSISGLLANLRYF